MSNQNQAFIEATIKLATPQEYVEGGRWYSDANRIAVTIAGRYDQPLEVVVGVIAALSPRNRWERNLLDAEQIIAAYRSGGLEAAREVKVCTFGANKKKALAILEDRGMAEEILSGPKLTEFFRCIMGYSDVCIDGHAWCIWANDRRGLKDVPSIGKRLREEIKADYKAVANRLGMHPWQAQAISWVVWRGLHGVA